MSLSPLPSFEIITGELITFSSPKVSIATSIYLTPTNQLDFKRALCHSARQKTPLIIESIKIYKGFLTKSNY